MPSFMGEVFGSPRAGAGATMSRVPSPFHRMSREILALVVAAACGLTTLAISSALAAPRAGDVLPDLVADTVSDVVLSTDSSGSSQRLLLRFAGYIHNDGEGALEIRGARPSTASQISVLQRYFDAGGAWHDDPSSAHLTYEFSDGHQHWHLMSAARYSLWNQARSAEAAPAMKVGFCLEDSQRVGSQGPRTRVYGGTRDHQFCAQGQPNALSVFQGVSAGWRDEYHNQLPFQWVDVSSVEPGSYWLRSDVDPGDVVTESVEDNQAAWAGSTTTIPGYVAQAVDRGQITPDSSAAVTLAAERFGVPGPVAYRIASGPSNGTLDLATGGSRSTPTVVYTPRPGFVGTDSFTYSARDSSSEFPRTPATATVSIRVGESSTPVVQISGAPDEMIAGTSAQLTATVTNDAAAVTWSVDGTAGGSTAAGTITSAGLYHAPPQPPGGGTVTITARSSRGASDERRVRIIPAPVPAPAPLPAPLPAPAAPGSGAAPASGLDASRVTGSGAPRIRRSVAARPWLTAPRVSRIGRELVVTTTPGRSGLVRLRVFAGRLLLGTCSTRTPAGRPFACRLGIADALRTDPRIAVVASLRVGGRVVAVRRRAAAPVARGHSH